MIPENLYYTEDHAWVRPEDDCIEVGVSEPLVRKLKPIISIDLLGVDVEMKRELPFLELEGYEETRHVYLPAETRILEINDELLWDQTKLEEDPYGEGWLMRIVSPGQKKLLHLMTETAYREHVAEQLGEEFADD